MTQFVRATVVRIITEREGLQKVQVLRSDRGPGEQAMVLTEQIGRVVPGDDVIVNTTAVDNELGTGGWHFVHWNLSRNAWRRSSAGNVMKLRYTSLQSDVGVDEELSVPAATLDGMPVICVGLLSQGVAAALSVADAAPHATLAFIMTDQAALSAAMSDVLWEMVEAKVISFVVTTGQATGGTYEAVNVASALCQARSHGARLAIVSPGPGIVGTATTYGFSSYEIAHALDDAMSLGGPALLGVRYSDADQRGRHRGLSHHTKTLLARAPHAAVAIPHDVHLSEVDSAVLAGRELDVVEVGDLESLGVARGIELTSMGRNYVDDPLFFRFAGAAGVLGAKRLAATETA